MELTAENIIVERKEKEDLKVINDGTLTVALDTKITDSLKKEGYVRDLVRGIQDLRKKSGFEITDRINLVISGDADLKSAFEMFKDFIASETLASTCSWADNAENEVKADEKSWRVSVAKA